MRDKAAEQPAAVLSQRKSDRIGVISFRHVTKCDSVPGRAWIYMPDLHMRDARRHNVWRVAGKPVFVKTPRMRGGGAEGVLSAVCLTHTPPSTRVVVPIHVKCHGANSLAVLFR